MLFKFSFLISVSMSFSLLRLLGIVVLNSHFVIVKDEIAFDSFLFNPVNNLFHLFLFDLVKVFMIATFEALCCSVDSFTIWEFFESFKWYLILLWKVLKELKVFLKSIACLFGVHFKWRLTCKCSFYKLTVCHFRSFFQSWCLRLQSWLRIWFLDE